MAGHNLTDLADIAALVSQLEALSWSAFLLVPTGRGKLLPALMAWQAEDVLNFVYDAGEFIPARTTEAHHFRRIVASARSCASTEPTMSRSSGLARFISACGTASPSWA
jgi:MoaA/NifB/PqqE/SkfB family radical SAM enzyme